MKMRMSRIVVTEAMPSISQASLVFCVASLPLVHLILLR